MGGSISQGALRGIMLVSSALPLSRNLVLIYLPKSSMGLVSLEKYGEYAAESSDFESSDFESSDGLSSPELPTLNLKRSPHADFDENDG